MIRKMTAGDIIKKSDDFLDRKLNTEEVVHGSFSIRTTTRIPRTT